MQQRGSLGPSLVDGGWQVPGGQAQQLLRVLNVRVCVWFLKPNKTQDIYGNRRDGTLTCIPWQSVRIMHAMHELVNEPRSMHGGGLGPHLWTVGGRYQGDRPSSSKYATVSKLMAWLALSRMPPAARPGSALSPDCLLFTCSLKQGP